MKRLSGLLGIALLVSACSVGHEEFDCPNSVGGYGCKGMKEVHELVNQRQNGEIVAPVIKDIPARNLSVHQIAQSDDSMISRSKEEQLRVWIAPFQDEQGNFHEPSVVHTVVRSGYWQMNPMSWE
jgi:conjugal transfer pilus assembly protein TraV